jgi:hypothetical protein
MLVMEFNELSPSLVEQSMKEFELLNFALLKKVFMSMETEANASVENLNPLGSVL